MRTSALAVVALVAAALGATAVLVVASAAGWIDDDGGTRTVVVSDGRRGDRPDARPTPAAASLLGNGFDPARIYASRSQGVVTIYSYFPNGRRSQGSGFVVSDEGHVLTNSHVVTNAGAGSTVRAASRVYVVFADGDRIPGSIVGWDLFNDIGLVKVDPRDHAVSPRAARRLEPLSSSASRSRRSAARSARRARSPSASSPRPSARSSPSPPSTTSRARSRSTRRSTTATRAARCSTPAAA